MTDRRHAALVSCLSEFVVAHPGARLGQVFGRPAAFAGTRVFAEVTPDGMLCRLPPGLVPTSRVDMPVRPARRRGWVLLAVADRRWHPLLELAATHTAGAAYR